jgi:hypothetical protein
MLPLVNCLKLGAGDTPGMSVGIYQTALRHIPRAVILMLIADTMSDCCDGNVVHWYTLQSTARRAIAATSPTRLVCVYYTRSMEGVMYSRREITRLGMEGAEENGGGLSANSRCYCRESNLSPQEHKRTLTETDTLVAVHLSTRRAGPGSNSVADCIGRTEAVVQAA